jgi:hypothetical protein
VQRWQPLLMVTAAALLTLSAGACSFTADETEKQDVADAVEAFPADVVTALRLGKVKNVYWGDVAQHVDAQRKVGLAVPEVPAAHPTTAGARTANCQAVVAALAPTNARLYGRLPHDSSGQWVEGTDELCQRGLGLSKDGHDEHALRIGVRRDATTMVDTGANYDPYHQLVIFSGAGGLPHGQTVPVTATTLAEVDRRVKPTKLPWRYSVDAPDTDRTVPDSLERTIVVPAGTLLRVTATCTGLPSASLMFDTDPRRNLIHIDGRAPESHLPEEGQSLVGCSGQALTRQLRPQLSYHWALTGQAVDQYEVEYQPGQFLLRRGDQSLRTIFVEALPPA